MDESTENDFPIVFPWFFHMVMATALLPPASQDLLEDLCQRIPGSRRWCDSKTGERWWFQSSLEQLVGGFQYGSVSKPIVPL